MNVIEFKNVWKQYHKREYFFAKSDLFWAIKDLSFAIKKGETVGLIGPNGAGKTTIVKLISEVTYPTQGSILVRGKVVPLISMGACLSPLLSIPENISLLMSIFDVEQRVRKKVSSKIIDFSGLKDFLEMPVKKLSLGMWSRLSLSVAVHVPQEILLIDEVLAMSDQEFQRELLQKIKQFGKTDKTIVFVSHNMDDVKKISDRVIWIESGKIYQQGPPDTVIAAYLKAKD